MAKSSSNLTNELGSITRKNSNLNSKTVSLASKTTNKLKIAHRTRSKCPIGEKSLNEIETQLPDDLLFDNNNIVSVFDDFRDSLLNLKKSNLYLEKDPSKSNHQADNLSLSTINDSLFTSASTPISINDPNDDLWFEFLNSLQQPKLLDENSSHAKENNSPSKLNDNDDANEDPDFTVCLESCDLEEPDYLDDWFQVPRREAIALVKDAMEFCDKVPIVYEDHRVKEKEKSLINKNQKNDKPSDINNFECSTTSSLSNIVSIDTTNSTINLKANSISNTSLTLEYIPQFTELQKKQLDEQLRNHVQLLTQTCVACYNSTEFKEISEEAKNLLNVLDNLNKTPINSHESIADSSKSLNALVAQDFEIISLADSINLIDNLKNLNMPTWNLNNGFPAKILEIIVDSRVFYNINLIPNNNKYKYSSQFTRSSFSDCEKILLIMGFNQFKHLPKDECCQCIKEFVLAHRSCYDIKKQLSSISNSENRQANLKELINRQKSLKSDLNEHFDFKKEIHYKSPLEQIDHINLPSMYTLPIERIKMANILKETRNYSNSKSQENSKRTIENQKEQVRQKKNKKKPTKNKSKVPSDPLTTNREEQTVEANESFESNDCTIIGNDNDIENSLNQTNCENDQSLLSNEPSKKRSKTVKSSEKVTTQNQDQNTANSSKINVSKTSESFVQLLSSNNLANLFSNKQPQQSIIIDNNGRIIPTNLSAMLMPSPSLSPFQYIPQILAQQQQQHYQPNSNLILPASFNGTILYHPTIHIHNGAKNSKDLSNYKKIAPKKKD